MADLVSAGVKSADHTISPAKFNYEEDPEINEKANKQPKQFPLPRYVSIFQDFWLGIMS